MWKNQALGFIKFTLMMNRTKTTFTTTAWILTSKAKGISLA